MTFPVFLKAMYPPRLYVLKISSKASRSNMSKIVKLDLADFLRSTVDAQTSTNSDVVKTYFLFRVKRYALLQICVTACLKGEVCDNY